MENILNDMLLKPHEGTLEYTAKDFKAGIDVRWCSGCGGYSILAQVQRILPSLGIPKEKFAFISGIGCSSRFPYYMNVFGLHSLHGRAIAIASGLKIARPDLSVWIATGDGDCISIGGNHFIHACRRNVDLNVVMFNNEVYSLTKGQYSPTSKVGQVTKSSPLGVLDDPFNPVGLALGSGATFVARGVDSDAKFLQHLFERAAAHKGFSYVEIYTDCVIYNAGAFEPWRNKALARENTVMLEHGKPLIFGENHDKGIKLDGFTPTVIDISNGHYSINDVLVHNENDSTLAFILANMTYNSDVPRPMGVFQAIEKSSYDTKVTEQLAFYAEQPGAYDYDLLLKGEDSWEITG
ncbi:MAG: 2-oxoacid:ferredoxin oxidoreductase subunit beta [Ignavibacteria bacterium]|nr:2-oxoacid:ferredoxin oxidoreductase subunit beta [Ignavibacteria bacterium]